MDCAGNSAHRCLGVRSPRRGSLGALPDNDLVPDGHDPPAQQLSHGAIINRPFKALLLLLVESAVEATFRALHLLRRKASRCNDLDIFQGIGRGRRRTVAMTVQVAHSRKRKVDRRRTTSPGARWQDPSQTPGTF
jgi:hypothetical protein